MQISTVRPSANLGGASWHATLESNLRSLSTVLSALAVAVFAAPAHVQAANESDVDRMTTYATVLGRALGCGVDVDGPSSRVGKWMDRTFPPGTQDQKTYLPVFLAGVRHHANAQRQGNSPDSCSKVKSSFSAFPWP